MALHVKESFPYFLASDGLFWTGLYFTSGAVSGFKAKHANVAVTDLAGRTIRVTDYDAVLSKSSSLTSYAGLEVRIVVKAFSLGDKSSGSGSPGAQNLYRTSSVKHALNSFQHGLTSKAAKGLKGDSLPDLGGKKGGVGQGVVDLGSWNSVGAAKAGTVNMIDIYKQEKGKLSVGKASSGHAAVRVAGGAKFKKSSAKKAGPGLSKVTQAIAKSKDAKTPGNQKKSVAPVSRKGPGAMASPGGSTGGNTPGHGLTKKSMDKLRRYLKGK